jgi:CRP/FNR family cyclic AMP-dependent transcriptional regulator
MTQVKSPAGRHGEVETMKTALEALKASKLGPELTEAQLETLAARVTLRTLHEGEVLVAEGTSDDHLYSLLSGALDVVRNAGKPEAVTLFTLTPGDLVGELSFLDATPHYASLVASGPAVVFGLERAQLESLLDSHPQVVYRVMRAIVRTTHQIQRRLSMQSVELTNYIHKQHGRY